MSNRSITGAGDFGFGFVLRPDWQCLLIKKLDKSAITKAHFLKLPSKYLSYLGYN